MADLFIVRCYSCGRELSHKEEPGMDLWSAGETFFAVVCAGCYAEMSVFERLTIVLAVRSLEKEKDNVRS